MINLNNIVKVIRFEVILIEKNVSKFEGEDCEGGFAEHKAPGR